MLLCSVLLVQVIVQLVDVAKKQAEHAGAGSIVQHLDFGVPKINRDTILLLVQNLPLLEVNPAARPVDHVIGVSFGVSGYDMIWYIIDRVILCWLYDLVSSHCEA